MKSHEDRAKIRKSTPFMGGTRDATQTEKRAIKLDPDSTTLSGTSWDPTWCLLLAPRPSSSVGGGLSGGGTDSNQNAIGVPRGSVQGAAGAGIEPAGTQAGVNRTGARTTPASAGTEGEPAGP